MERELPLFPTEALTAGLAPLFQGRRELVSGAVKVLVKPSQTCVIFGERGVGKTSLAWQVMAALTGTVKEYTTIANRYKISPGDYISIPIKGMTAPSGVNELLVQAIAPSRDPLSLQMQVPILYQSDELLSYIKQKFSINLLSLNDLLLFAKDSEYKELVQALFDDVLGFAKSKGLVKNVIFFVDEADEIPNKDGLGKLVKNAKFAKFVFVGIADTIQELISDHLSASRKLIAGDIEVKPLTHVEIRSIFKDAEMRSHNRISFSEGFLAKATKYSSGFPWIAQHLGDQAIDEVDISENTIDNFTQVISEHKFIDVFPIVRRNYIAKKGATIDYNAVSSSRVAERCCKYLISTGSAKSIEEIHTSLKGNLDVVRSALNELIGAGILRRRVDGMYRFEDPIVRSFVTELLEK